MPTPTLITVKLHASSGLPEDDATIDLAANPTTLNSGFADDVQTAVEAFFNTLQTIPGTDSRLRDFIGYSWAPDSADNLTISLYDLTGFLSGTPHGSPDFVRMSAVDHADVPSYPNEVSLKSTIHADLSGVPEISGSTRPAARRRGGFFVPWIVIPYKESTGDSTNSTTFDGNNNSRPSQDLQDTLLAATKQLDGEIGLHVWSRADATLYPVVNGWVDNAWDTQRRRGVSPTTRTVWP